MMRPLRASGAHSSSNSLLGPLCNIPGVASTTQGGPSAIFRSHPRCAGTLEIYLSFRLNTQTESSRRRTHLKTKGLSRFANLERMFEFMVWI